MVKLAKFAEQKNYIHLNLVHKQKKKTAVFNNPFFYPQLGSFTAR